MGKIQGNPINHIAMVLDMSGSMGYRKNELVNVVDGQIKYLAQRSKELDQETRVTVYVFDNVIECVFYDKDVLRLPSIKEHYQPRGMTRLIDATAKALDDLAKTPELYGDHAFLTYVFTDGAENASRMTSGALASKINGLRDNWTVAVLVPDQNGKFEAKKMGFPADNIAVWSANNSRGIQEVGETIRRATDSFMVGRTTGVRGTRSLFSTGAEAVNAQTVKAAGLKPLADDRFMLVPVVPGQPVTIKEFVEGCGYRYVTGRAFYQLSKSEKIQPQKKLVVVEKRTNKVFVGEAVRDLIGLPDLEVRVKPDFNPDYEIFVQSTSVNRKLVVGTKLMMLA